MDSDRVEILLVEDNPHDADMTKRTLTKQNILATLYWVKDGQDALDFLYCQGTYAGRQGLAPPKVILLDIKMPKVNGIEVLQTIKADHNLCFIPVVILTSSNEQSDVAEAYRLGVNSYIVKPVDFDAFNETLARIGVYWTTTNCGSRA